MSHCHCATKAACHTFGSLFTLNRLKRVTAWMLRFINNCRASRRSRNSVKSNSLCFSVRELVDVGFLSPKKAISRWSLSHSRQRV